MSTNKEVKDQLRAATPSDRVKFRIGRKYAQNKRAHMLAYVDARYVQDRLDDTVGTENWSNSFAVIDNTLFCSITVNFPDGESVTKSDCGTESNVEKEKGEASDAFKRAAVMLGIGRDLYEIANKFNMHADLNDAGYPPKNWSPQGWGDHNHKEQRHVQVEKEPTPQKPQPTIKKEEPVVQKEQSDLQSFADSIVEKHEPNAPDDTAAKPTFVNEKPIPKQESNTEYVTIKNLRLDHETEKSRLLVPSTIAKGSDEAKGNTFWITKQFTKDLIRMNSGLYTIVAQKWTLKDKPYEFEPFDQEVVHKMIEEEAQKDQNDPQIDEALPF